jgi:TolB protein
LYAYPLEPDGAEATYLTELPRGGVGRRISVSADGSMLAFSLLRRGTSQIWVASIDGSGLRRLTDDAYEATDPAFSPDGSEIAYIGFGSNGRRELFVLDVATGSTRQVTHGSSEPFWPSWSPDAETIVVSQAKPADVSVWSGTDHVGLFSVDVRTGATSRLRMQAGASNAYADYSQTGSALAFLHWLPGGPSSVAVAGVDGSGIDVVGESLQTGGRQYPPDVAPSGARVAFDQSDHDGGSSTYVLTLSRSSDLVRLPASTVGWLDGETLVVQVGG